MAERSGTAAECNGLDVLDLICIDTGIAGLDGLLAVISALVPAAFGLWMKLLGGETWRIRVGHWLYDANCAGSLAASGAAAPSIPASASR